MINKTILLKYVLAVVMLTILHGLPACGKIMTLEQLLDIETINNDRDARFPLGKLSDELASDDNRVIMFVDE